MKERPTKCSTKIHHALRVPLQLGYREHPQNSLPTFAPRFAERRTIGLLQIGQSGSADGDLASTVETVVDIGAVEVLDSVGAVLLFCTLMAAQLSIFMDCRTLSEAICCRRVAHVLGQLT